jgi:ankyrin repeat protein
MMRLLATSLMLFFLSGCVATTQERIEASINTDAIEGGEIALLETYKDNSYITSSKQALPAHMGEYSNAMEAAIYKRNIEAVRYLISINAANKVSIHHTDNTQWVRTPVTIPAAELACGVATFDIMDLLLESYPEDKPNYTNCLHYLIASYHYYPSLWFFSRNKNPIPQWRNGENTALAAEKIIALGGDPNALPNYGVTLYEKVLEPQNNNLLSTLLENGMDPNTQYDCDKGNGLCTFLSKLSFYEDEATAIERAKLLVESGAEVNTRVNTAVITGADPHHGLIFKQQEMTALHMARFFDRNKLAETLIELGADPALANAEGKTAESYAGGFSQTITGQTQQATTTQSNGSSGASKLLGIISGAVEIMDMR